MLLLPPLGHPVQERDSRKLHHPAHGSASNADGFRLTLPLDMRWSKPLKPHFLEVGSQMESLPDRTLCLLSGGAKSARKANYLLEGVFCLNLFSFLISVLPVYYSSVAFLPVVFQVRRSEVVLHSIHVGA